MFDNIVKHNANHINYCYVSDIVKSNTTSYIFKDIHIKKTFKYVILKIKGVLRVKIIDYIWTLRNWTGHFVGGNSLL